VVPKIPSVTALPLPVTTPLVEMLRLPFATVWVVWEQPLQVNSMMLPETVPVSVEVFQSAPHRYMSQLRYCRT
jgi:hypothetical protein